MNFSKISDAINETAPRTSGISPYVDLEMSTVYPNPDQPRKDFKNIDELAESIKEHGLLQPIVVELRSDGYMIVGGERRWRACVRNNARTITAFILSEDHDAQELALIENIQREDLSDFEIAKFIGTLWASGKYKLKSDLAQVLAKKQSYISKAFSCLKLDESIIADLEETKFNIGLSVLDEISRLDPAVQVETYTRYKAGEIKRDEFKKATKPKVEKVSRGKSYCTSGFIAKGNEVIDRVNQMTFDPAKKYDVTIKEV